MKRVCTRPNSIIREGDEYRFLGRKEAQYANALGGDVFRVRCNSCLNCRIHRAMGWAIRGQHEMQSTYRPTWAITLTYDQDHVPASGSLVRQDVTDFHRRLHYNFGSFRHLTCGEYGPTTGRAHYHGVYFGLQLPDSYKGAHHWGSQALLDTWGKGHIALHLATQQSISYVSGYCVKKLRAPRGTRPVMETVDPVTGLVTSEETVEPEFLGFSKLPALGGPWIDQFQDQVIRDGYILFKEKPCYVIPDFYMKVLRDHPDYESFSARRLEKATVEDELSCAQLKALERNVESEMARTVRGF